MPSTTMPLDHNAPQLQNIQPGSNIVLQNTMNSIPGPSRCQTSTTSVDQMTAVLHNQAMTSTSASNMMLPQSGMSMNASLQPNQQLNNNPSGTTKDKYTILQFVEEFMPSTNQPSVSHSLPCTFSIKVTNGDPDINADQWPGRLMLQLIPGSLLVSLDCFRRLFLKSASRSLVIRFNQESEPLSKLCKIMSSDLKIGCIQFPQNCDIRIMVVLYIPNKKIYMGFIPNDQGSFIHNMRQGIKTLRKQKQRETPAPILTGTAALQVSPGVGSGGLENNTPSRRGSPEMPTTSVVTTANQAGPSGGPRGFKDNNKSLKRKLTKVKEPANKKILLNLENKLGFYEEEIEIKDDLLSELKMEKRQRKKDNDKLQMEIYTMSAEMEDVKSKLKQAQDEATIKVHEVERQKKIDFDRLQMKIDSLEEKCSNKDAQIADITSESAETVRNLNFDIQRLDLSVSMLKEENEKSQDEIQILKREKIHLIEDAAKGRIIEKELKEAKDKIKMLENKIKDKDAALTFPVDIQN